MIGRVIAVGFLPHNIKRPEVIVVVISSVLNLTELNSCSDS